MLEHRTTLLVKEVSVNHRAQFIEAGVDFLLFHSLRIFLAMLFNRGA